MTGCELNIGDMIISHIGFMPYRNYEISIYERVGIVQEDNSKRQYFFEPIALLDHTSANYQLKSFANFEHHVSLNVTMWDEDVKRKVTQFIKDQQQRRTSEWQVHVIPFKELNFSCAFTGDAMKNQPESWQPYHQHKTISFDISCPSEENAKKLVKQIKNNPENFANAFKISFTSIKRTERKEVLISVRDVTSTEFFAKLPRADEYVLTADDAHTLLTQATDNVMRKSFKHSEIGCPENGQNVYSALQRAMVTGREQVGQDSEPEAWDALFWDDADHSRPDRMARLLNDAYTRLEGRTKEQLTLRSYVAGQLEIRNDIVFAIEPRLVITAGGSRNNDNNENDDNDAGGFRLTRDEIRKTEWNDDAAGFVPKAIDLIRINMTRLREERELTAHVAYSPTILSMAINISEKSLFDWVNRKMFIFLFFAFVIVLIGCILASNNSLSTTLNFGNRTWHEWRNMLYNSSSSVSPKINVAV